MAPRRDCLATDIARENADVLNTGVAWLTRLVFLNAAVCFSVETAVGLHAHVTVTPTLWMHDLGVGGTTGSLRHLIVLLMVTFIGVTLESLVLCRDAFARGEPGAVATLLATARRLVLGARRAEVLIVGSPGLRVTSRVDDEPDSGILHQLRVALSIAPMGPPARRAFSSDPWGPFGQSGQRVEVCAAA